MRVAWLVDEHTPAPLVPAMVANGTGLARRGCEVLVFGAGERPEWVLPPLAFQRADSLKVAPEALWDCDAVIGTHWSHVGACVDAGLAAPFLLVREAGEGADGLPDIVRSLPISILAVSQATADAVRKAGVRGGVYVLFADEGAVGGSGEESGSRDLEHILSAAACAHRARIPDRVTLGLAMIVRDEQENLRRCLASVASVVDEMVVVDTGSRDQTVRVARDAGATVVKHEWKDDFARARNAGLEHLTTDWVLVLDADEQLAPSSGHLVRRAITNPLVDGFLVDIFNFLGDRTPSGGVVHANVRLFRHLPGVRYEGALHEQVSPSLIRAGRVIRPLPGAVILHYGYLSTSVEGYDKKRRNLEIVRRQADENPDHPFVQFNLGVEYMRQGDSARATKTFQRAFRLLPGPEVPYAPALVRHLAACLIEGKRYDEALALLEHGQEVYPDYVDLRYLRGAVLNRLGRYQEALGTLADCVKSGDAAGVYSFSQVGAGSFLARAAMVESYLGLGRIEEAIEEQEAASKEMGERLGEVLSEVGGAGSDVLNLWVSAESHLRKRQFEQAVTAYRELLGAGHRQAFLTTQLAQLWPRKVVLELAAGQADAARQDLDLLAGVNPRGARAARLVLEPWLSASAASPAPAASPAGSAWAGPVASGGWDGLRRQGSEDGRGGHGSQSGRGRGGTERVHWRDVAPVLVTMLDVGREDWFERACALLRGGLMESGELDTELGKLYFQRGLHERAAEHLLAGLQQGCADPVALRALGEISLERGLHSEGRTFLREAVRQRPADPAAWVALALSYHRFGRDRAGLRVLDLARRHSSGEVIHTTRLALKLHRRVAGQGEGGPGRDPGRNRARELGRNPGYGRRPERGRDSGRERGGRAQGRCEDDVVVECLGAGHGA